MKDPVVMAVADDSASAYGFESRSAWKMLFVLGLGVAMIGSVDVALLLYPARLSSLDWEFGTISGIVDGLPLITIGLGVMTASAVARGWVRGRRLMIGVTLILAVLIALMVVVFVLDIPAVLRAVDPAMKQSIKKAMFKTTVIGFFYVVLYATLGMWTWRLRVGKGAVR